MEARGWSLVPRAAAQDRLLRAKRAWPQTISKRHEQHSRPDTAAVRWQDIQLPWPKVPGRHVARPENHPPELDTGGTRPYSYDIATAPARSAGPSPVSCTCLRITDHGQRAPPWDATPRTRWIAAPKPSLRSGSTCQPFTVAGGRPSVTRTSAVTVSVSSCGEESSTQPPTVSGYPADNEIRRNPPLGDPRGGAGPRSTAPRCRAVAAGLRAIRHPSHCVIGVRPGTRASPQPSPASRARSMA